MRNEEIKVAHAERRLCVVCALSVYSYILFHMVPLKPPLVQHCLRLIIQPHSALLNLRLNRPVLDLLPVKIDVGVIRGRG